MGLSMKAKKKIRGEIYKRHQKAGNKDKGGILGEHAPLLVCNRDCLAYRLTNWGKTRYALVDGKFVKCTAKPVVKGRRKAPVGKKTGRPEKYNPAFVAVLRAVWEPFGFQCGKLLAPLIRGMMGYLVIEFKLSEALQALLKPVISAAIDRKLRKAKQQYRLKGIHTTMCVN